jgi:GDP-4-dehydro-6-deoxy-D-mannose reductase
MASGSPSTLSARVEYYELDIRREDDVRSAVRQIGPSEIYHLAGVSAVDLSWANSRLTFEVNVIGTYNLLEAAMGLASPPRILNISTAQVYARSDAPLTESSPVGPGNPYAASKAIAEMLEVSFRKTSTGGVITARSFNHTGPGQLPTFVLPAFAKQFAEIEAGIRPPLLAVGNIDVERDFTDVRDVVSAYSALLRKGRTGQVYNVCSGIGILLSDVIKQFQALCKTVVTIETDPTRVRTDDIHRICGDSTKIRNEIGWNIRIPMSEIVRDLLDYWREKVRVSGTMEV